MLDPEMVTCGSKPSEPRQTPPTVPEFCHAQGAALFTAAARLFGQMDELGAAAAVQAMDVDSNSEEELEQDRQAGVPGGNLPAPSACEPSPEDKENKRDLPERQRGRAADKKVTTDAQKVRNTI